jgi:hypothetical protein
MGTASDYRQFATEQRQAAERTLLPLPRQRHLEAAKKRDLLADEIVDRRVGRRAKQFAARSAFLNSGR